MLFIGHGIIAIGVFGITNPLSVVHIEWEITPLTSLSFTVDSQVFLDRLNVTTKCLILVSLFKIRHVMKL